MKNRLFRNNPRNYRIYIKDIIEFILQNRKMMKLLIMVDTRLCINVIRKVMGTKTMMREEVEELCKRMILWVQTVIKIIMKNKDLITNNQLI